MDTRLQKTKGPKEVAPILFWGQALSLLWTSSVTLGRSLHLFTSQFLLNKKFLSFSLTQDSSSIQLHVRGRLRPLETLRIGRRVRNRKSPAPDSYQAILRTLPPLSGLAPSLAPISILYSVLAWRIETVGYLGSGGEDILPTASSKIVPVTSDLACPCGEVARGRLGTGWGRFGPEAAQMLQAPTLPLQMAK